MDTLTIGKYKIVRDIASGGMADVFEAVDKSGNRFAIRLISSSVTLGKKEIAEFLDGAEISSDLNHPNIVRVFEIGKHDGRPYSVMEYVQGETLRELIANNLEWVRQHALHVMRGVARALVYIHERGIIHRDIKPENILISSNDAVKLIDFSLAIRSSDEKSLRKKGKISGTPSYISPEQLMNEKIDERSDIYSLGVTAYEMFSGGRLPYEAPSVDLIMQMHFDPGVHPKPLALYNPQILPTVESSILRCLEKKPEKRYNSSALLLLDITRIFKR